MIRKRGNMKNIKDINELRFCLTEDMNNIFIELIITKQLLEESMAEDTKITDEERGALYQHYTKLNDTFIREFRKNNKEQIKKYNELMNK